MKFLKKFKEIKGDASSRKFYRNKKNNSIIVYAKKDKKKNLLTYDAVNKILIKNKVLAPKLINQNYKKNYIEIQDLGNENIYQILKKKKINNLFIMKKAINTLNNLQLIRDKKIKNFKNKYFRIKNYENNILFDEAKLFIEWYLPNKVSKKKIKNLNQNLTRKLNFYFPN